MSMALQYLWFSFVIELSLGAFHLVHTHLGGGEKVSSLLYISIAYDMHKWGGGGLDNCAPLSAVSVAVSGEGGLGG